MPGEVYREFAKYLFQQNLLTKNRMPLGRHIVDLRKITCPLLNLMARNDDLVPCAQTEPLNDLVSSTDKEKIIWPAGHIGLAVSGRAQKELWPRAVDWLVQRTDSDAAVPSRPLVPIVHVTGVKRGTKRSNKCTPAMVLGLCASDHEHSASQVLRGTELTVASIGQIRFASL